MMRYEEEERENERVNTDVSTLTSWWIQEEASPEILDFQTQLVEEIYGLVRDSNKFYFEISFISKHRCVYLCYENLTFCSRIVHSFFEIFAFSLG